MLSVYLLISSSLYFLYFYDAHRDLHSFPTRRSSDLHGHRALEYRIRGRSASPGIRADSCIYTPVDRAARSEEHTSELQSRGHLVCRLLLEKKKKRNDS